MTSAGGVVIEETRGHELADHGLPFFFLARRAAAEHRKIAVAAGNRLLGIDAAQHVDNVRGAITLAGTPHRRQNLARVLAAIRQGG